MLSTEQRNWKWIGVTVLVAVVIPTLISLWHDPFRTYATTADADIIYFGQVLRLGDGLSQTFYDQSAHTYILVLFGWTKLWALLGLVPDPSLAAAVASADIDDYAQPLTVAGRALSMVLSSLFVLLMMVGARSMGLSKPIVFALGLVVATSHTLTIQSQMMSVNLLSAMGVFAVFFALVQSQKANGRRHLMWLFLAGVFSILAMDTKVMAIIPLLGVAVLSLALGPLRRPSPPVFVDLNTYTFAAFVLAVTVPFVTVVAFSLRDMAGPLTGYQGVALGWVIGCMMGYGYIYRESVARQVTAALALMAGLSIGASVLFIWHTHKMLDWIVHFVEAMARQTHVNETGYSVALFLGHFTNLIGERLDNLLSPTGLLEVMAVLIVILLFRRGDRGRALMVLFIFGLGIAVEAGTGLRGYKVYYRIFVDPWLFLAVAIGLDALIPWKQFQARALFSGGVVLLAGWLTTMSLEDKMIPRQLPENVCYRAHYLDAALAERFKSYCPDEQN